MLALVVLIGFPQHAPDLDKYVLPLSKPIACPMVGIDVSDLPAAQPWLEKAKALVEAWFPQVTSLLDTADYSVPKEIMLVVKKSISNPAYTSNATITVSGDWITKH